MFVFQEEMTEENSCFIVPIISTLKHLARHNANIRQNLIHNEQFLLSVIKSKLMYYAMSLCIVWETSQLQNLVPRVLEHAEVRLVFGKTTNSH